MSASVPDLAAIGVRFATFRDVDADGRARLADELREAIADEAVLLETCHRVELVAVHGPLPTLRGADAVRRVFEVVAGFDSAIVAEEQIIGQARAAYETALATGRSGPVLNELFRRALRFGRRVRAHARPGTDRSLADPGVAWLLRGLPAGGRVVVAGTGEMGRLVAKRLAGRGFELTVVTRSEERGARMLERLPGAGHRIAVGGLHESLVRAADAVVLATRSRAALLTSSILGEARPWTLDLSAPSVVDVDAAAALGDRLRTIDRLGAGVDGPPVLDAAAERRLRDELELEVDRFTTWLEERRAGDAVAILRAEADAVRRRHLARLGRRAGLDERQVAAVEAASAAMLGELLHGPTVELRRGGADADAVRRLFGLEARS